MTTDELNAARDTAAAILAAELAGKGYEPSQLVTIAFMQGVVFGIKETHALFDAPHATGTTDHG